MSFFKNLFGRRSRRFNLFRRRSHRFADNINPRTGGIALGAMATLAAPFVIRKLMARRAEQDQAGTATAY
ncbi:MAG TPA: hypothetical protein VLB44_21500 [Kofleriaceae bacterium]|nr:hypothetical protein [Kofleriaceae bacterium]